MACNTILNEGLSVPRVWIAFHHLLPILAPPVAIVKDINITRSLHHYSRLSNRSWGRTYVLRLVVPLPARQTYIVRLWAHSHLHNWRYPPTKLLDMSMFSIATITMWRRWIYLSISSRLGFKTLQTFASSRVHHRHHPHLIYFHHRPHCLMQMMAPSAL